MKHKSILIVLCLFILASCGRTDSAFIVNKTNDSLLLTLQLNYPYSEFVPDNYFRESIIKREKSTVKDWKLAGDCVMAFDSLSNIATLKLNPGDKIQLGTIRSGLSRDDYRTWEFKEINIKGNDFELHAKGKGIMIFVKSHKHWYTQYSHDFIIGTE